MPTDHSTIKWACDLCGTAWTGPDSAHTAAACEATGAPEPLPPETWILLSGFASDWDEMTTGGFRLAQVGSHTVANTGWMSSRPSPGPQPHKLRYDAFTSQGLYSDGLFPHQPGVLNLTNISAPALHDDRIETLLRDTGTAEEFSAMLSGFGVTLGAEMIAKLAYGIYGSLDFGLRSTERPGQATALPPLSSMTPELQAAFRAVAATKPLAVPGSLDSWNVLTPAMEIMHQYRECDGNIAMTTARLLTGHGESLADHAARWWNGDDVTLLGSALTYSGGTETKGGNLALTVEQRNVLRAAGFEVPWPARFKNTGTINSPHAALEALLENITYLEAPMPATTKLFDVETSIAVASGKTTVAAALAKALTARGKNVLAIDLDFHGPSLGHLLGLGPLTMSADAKIIPTTLADGTRAVSLSQFLAPNSPVTWRGAAVEGFLLFLGARLDLTGIDTIVFDLPPGTGDVERAVMKYARPDGAVLVTTGSDLSHADCRRAGMFLQGHNVPILGVVENLSRRTVTTPGGETVELRIFGEEADTIAFAAGLEFHNGWRTRYAPAYLGSLPFGAAPEALAASPEFAAVADAVEACAPEPEDPDAVTSHTITVAMSMDPEFTAILRG